ncbi:MAG: YdcF family protein [Chitinophagaceae bacterium]
MYHSGFAPTIIVAGGSNNVLRKQPAEADFVANELMACGVKKEAILIENKSVNTYQNAINTKKLIDSLHLQPPYLLVSSAVHLPRAISLFEKIGLKVTPHAAAYDAIPQKWYFTDAIIPSISLLDKWGSLLKEISGLYIYKLSGKA